MPPTELIGALSVSSDFRVQTFRLPLFVHGQRLVEFIATSAKQPFLATGVTVCLPVHISVQPGQTHEPLHKLVPAHTQICTVCQLACKCTEATGETTTKNHVQIV